MRIGGLSATHRVTYLPVNGSRRSNIRSCAVSIGVHSPKAHKNDAPLNVVFVGTGSYLLSRAVSSQVPSAYKSLTTVFGMGTGGTS